MYLNLKQFEAADLLDFNICCFDEGDGALQTLKNNCAKWHKSCRCKYGTQKYNALILKRSAPIQTQEATPAKVTRSKLDA